MYTDVVFSLKIKATTGFMIICRFLSMLIKEAHLRMHTVSSYCTGLVPYSQRWVPWSVLLQRQTKGGVDQQGPASASD